MKATNMIDDEREAIVRSLKKKGLSARQIAKAVGIARDTVRSILRAPIGSRQKKDRRPQQCPQCRYTVVLPCVICGYRKKPLPKPSHFRDNLFLSIVYPTTLDHVEPHTPQDESQWDEAFLDAHPWLRDQDKNKPT